MRLITTYFTMVLVGAALGRNIETNEAGKNDKAPLPSGVETLENLPVYYRNQMRQKLPDSKKASNTAEYLKPIEIAPQKENVIPTAADAKEQAMVKQPTLGTQLTQKIDTIKIKELEIKEKDKDKEPSKISQPQSVNDKIKAIPNLKETIMAPNSGANAKIDAEPKPVEVIREAKGIPAISSPLEQSNANEKENLKAEPQGHEEANLKENVKKESVKVEKSKSQEAKSESSKKSEVKNNAEEHLGKKNSADVHKKEIKNNTKSSEEKGSLKVNEVDLEKNLVKVPKQAEHLSKEKDSHKNKDKNYEKKKKEEHENDDSDDDSDDDDSSDGEDD